MKIQKKAIITCAITGSIHTPSMSAALPVEPEEIARQAIAAVEAGAAVIHLHARRPEKDGQYGFPDWRPETYRAFVDVIAKETDAIINITTGGGPGFTFEQRMAGPEALAPEITSFNLGCVNFGLFQFADNLKDAQHPWEQAFWQGTLENPYLNSYGMMKHVGDFGKRHNVRFEFECFDVGHLHALKTCRDLGWLPDGPLFIQCVLGVPGGLSADTGHLVHMRDTAERLFGGDFQMSALGAGRYQMNVAAAALSMGMHCRVGLEDSLGLGKGELAPDNAAQVTRVRTIMDALSIEAATPQEARAMLATKGADKVAFGEGKPV